MYPQYKLKHLMSTENSMDALKAWESVLNVWTINVKTFQVI